MNEFRVKLIFPEGFWCFTSDVKKEKDIENFAKSLEAYRNIMFPVDTKLVQDDFTGWYSPSENQSTVASMQQQFNQLAIEISKAPYNTALQVEKVILMLNKKYAQQKLRDFESLKSLPQIAVSTSNSLLMTVLFQMLSRDSLTHHIKGGGQSILTCAAQYGTVSSFMYIKNHPKLEAENNFFLCYQLRTAMTHALETATAGVGLPPGRLEIIKHIVEQRDLDFIHNFTLFKVKWSCELEGCTRANKHCNPIQHLLIFEGAPFFFGGQTLKICDKRKVMLCEEMNARAIDFRVAIAMGLHNRLGAKSHLKRLGADLVLYIIMLAGIGMSNTPDDKYRWFPRAPLESWTQIRI
jgi:hypothetical protein